MGRLQNWFEGLWRTRLSVERMDTIPWQLSSHVIASFRREGECVDTAGEFGERSFSWISRKQHPLGTFVQSD